MKKLLIAILFLSGYAYAQVASDAAIKKSQTNTVTTVGTDPVAYTQY